MTRNTRPVLLAVCSHATLGLVTAATLAYALHAVVRLADYDMGFSRYGQNDLLLFLIRVVMFLTSHLIVTAGVGSWSEPGAGALR